MDKATSDRIADDVWQRRATAAAIAAAKQCIVPDVINPRAMVGSLSDHEWGWIVSGAVFGWIKTRAEQAATEGSPAEMTIMSLGLGDPDPWRAGAIETILGGLAGIPDLDWGRPLGEWTKQEIIRLVHYSHKLADAALVARNEEAGLVMRPASHVAREVNATAGNGLLAPCELTEALFP